MSLFVRRIGGVNDFQNCNASLACLRTSFHTVLLFCSLNCVPVTLCWRCQSAPLAFTYVVSLIFQIDFVRGDPRLTYRRYIGAKHVEHKAGKVFFLIQLRNFYEYSLNEEIKTLPININIPNISGGRKKPLPRRNISLKASASQM